MWCAHPFVQFRQYVQDVGRLHYLTIRGAHALSHLHNTMQVLYKGSLPPSFPTEPDEAEAALENSRQITELALGEIASGFPIMHSHALVGLWGALEVCIDDIAVLTLQNDETIRSSNQLSRVKVSLMDIESLDQEERMRLLLSEAKRQIQSDARIGINAFEAILDLLRLSGGVESGISRDILEAQQLRNALIHRRGIVDRRVITRCPWLGANVGDHIVITNQQFSRLTRSMLEYASAVENRVNGKYGAPVA